MPGGYIASSSLTEVIFPLICLLFLGFLSGHFSLSMVVSFLLCLNNCRKINNNNQTNLYQEQICRELVPLPSPPPLPQLSIVYYWIPYKNAYVKND